MLLCVCSFNEIVLGVQGSMGLRGEKGDAGVQGPPGLAGSEGVPGIPGMEYVYWKLLLSQNGEQG